MPISRRIGSIRSEHLPAPSTHFQVSSTFCPSAIFYPSGLMFPFAWLLYRLFIPTTVPSCFPPPEKPRIASSTSLSSASWPSFWVASASSWKIPRPWCYWSCPSARCGHFPRWCWPSSSLDNTWRSQNLPEEEEWWPCNRKFAIWAEDFRHASSSWIPHSRWQNFWICTHP